MSFEKATQYVLLVLITASGTGGCIASGSGMDFGIVAVDQVSVTPRLIQPNVTGEDCPRGKYGSYEEATNRAIASAARANALTNAEFISRVNSAGDAVCVTVAADAVRL